MHLCAIGVVMVKLVRDCIPQIIEEDGKRCNYRLVHGVDEHMVFLKAKMSEEIQEFFENPCHEEAADMLEVVKALCYLNKLDFDVALSVAQDKWETHGGFEGGVMLLGVE